MLKSFCLFLGHFEERVEEERQNVRFEAYNVIHAEEILEHFNYEYGTMKNTCAVANFKMIQHFEGMWDCNGSTQEIFTTDREGRPMRHPHSEAITTFLLFFDKLERMSRYSDGTSCTNPKLSPCKF